MENTIYAARHKRAGFAHLVFKEDVRFVLHLAEQYLISCHTFSHFLRQLKGRPQTAQIFCGRSRFLTPFIFPSFFHSGVDRVCFGCFPASIEDSCAFGFFGFAGAAL